jgi:hypothetical protein
MSPGHSEIMSPGVPTSCRLVERRPAGGWFLPSSGVLVNPLRLISVGFAAGRWNPAIAIAYGAPRAIRESAADMAATVHYAVDRSGFRRHTRPSPTRAAPHSSLEVSVPVPAPNRRALQRGCHLCSDTALSGWDRQFESAFLLRRVCKLSVPQRGSPRKNKGIGCGTGWFSTPIADLPKDCHHGRKWLICRLDFLPELDILTSSGWSINKVPVRPRRNRLGRASSLTDS